MNGFSTKDLIWMVIGEILFIIGASTVGGSIIGMILCQLFLGRVVSIGYILIPALFSGVLPFIIAVKKLLSTDLCVYLREE